ncbi:MAG: putative quinol monooxygenase [Desulforhopalus sp.]
MLSYRVEIAVNPKKTGEFLEFCHYIANEFRHENGYRALQIYQGRYHAYNYILRTEWESEESMENHLGGDKFSLLKGGAIVLGQNFKLILGEAAITDHAKWKRLSLPW